MKTLPLLIVLILFVFTIGCNDDARRALGDEIVSNMAKNIDLTEAEHAEMERVGWSSIDVAFSNPTMMKVQLQASSAMVDTVTYNNARNESWVRSQLEYVDEDDLKCDVWNMTSYGNAAYVALHATTEELRRRYSDMYFSCMRIIVEKGAMSQP